MLPMMFLVHVASCTLHVAHGTLFTALCARHGRRRHGRVPHARRMRPASCTVRVAWCVGRTAALAPQCTTAGHAARCTAPGTVARMRRIFLHPARCGAWRRPKGCFLRRSPSGSAPHVCVQGFFGVVLYLWGGNAMFESVTISKPEMTSFVRACGGRSGGSRIGRRCAAEGCAYAAV